MYGRHAFCYWTDTGQETAPLSPFEDLREYFATHLQPRYVHCTALQEIPTHEAVVCRTPSQFIVDMEYEKIEAVARAEYKSVSEAILELPSDYTRLSV